MTLQAAASDAWLGVTRVSGHPALSARRDASSWLWSLPWAGLDLEPERGTARLWTNPIKDKLWGTSGHAFHVRFPVCEGAMRTFADTPKYPDGNRYVLLSTHDEWGRLTPRDPAHGRLYQELGRVPLRDRRGPAPGAEEDQVAITDPRKERVFSIGTGMAVAAEGVVGALAPVVDPAGDIAMLSKALLDQPSAHQGAVNGRSPMSTPFAQAGTHFLRAMTVIHGGEMSEGMIADFLKEQTGLGPEHAATTLSGLPKLAVNVASVTMGAPPVSTVPGLDPVPAPEDLADEATVMAGEPHEEPTMS
mgnify:CR=1 FL=1